MKHLVLLLSICLLFGVLSTQNALSEEDIKIFGAENWAVIVGVDDYYPPGPGGPDLKYTDDDAYDLYYRLLSDPVHWQADHIGLLIGADATKANIQAIIGLLAQVAGPDDMVLFYFSGHGTHGPDISPIDESDGYDEYLCAHDLNNIRDDELEEWFTDIQAAMIVAGADSCFPGIDEGMRKIPRTTTKTLPVPKVPLTDGFDKDLAGPGRVIVMAAEEDEYSYEDDSLQNGVFSYYFIEGISELGDSEGNSDGEASTEEAFNYAEPRVVSFTGGSQNPQMNDQFIGEISLIQMGGPPSIVVTTNGTVFSAGDTQIVDVHVQNPGEEDVQVWVLVCLELADGSFLDDMIVAGLYTLPAGLDKTGTLFTFTVPPIPPGEYCWHSMLVAPYGSKIISYDNASWEFIGKGGPPENLEGLMGQIRRQIKIE